MYLGPEYIDLVSLEGFAIKEVNYKVSTNIQGLKVCHQMDRLSGQDVNRKWSCYSGRLAHLAKD